MRKFVLNLFSCTVLRRSRESSSQLHNKLRRFGSDATTGLTLISYKNGIKKITLNDAKRRNSLSLTMLNELQSHLSSSLCEADLQVIVLASNGPAFSSGHNLKELVEDTGKEYHTEVFQKCSEVMKLVQDVPVPVIAQVNGIATAAGCQLVASCDLAVATESSKFATPGVSIGLFCSTPAVALARAVPRKLAMKMLLTAEPISATEALQFGLVSHITTEENLEREVQQLAEKISSFSKPVIGLGKKTFYEQISKGRDDAYDIAEDVMVCNLEYPDAQEGIAAFLSKRKPAWSHKGITKH